MFVFRLLSPESELPYYKLGTGNKDLMGKSSIYGCIAVSDDAVIAPLFLEIIKVIISTEHSGNKIFHEFVNSA